MTVRNRAGDFDAAYNMAQNAISRLDTGVSAGGIHIQQPFSYHNPELDKPVTIDKNHVFVALMVAPRRCGKTTLLSAIYREFYRVMGENFVMRPFRMEESQLIKLEDNKRTLNDFSNAPGFNEGLAPSDTLETYEFLIYEKTHP